MGNRLKPGAFELWVNSKLEASLATRKPLDGKEIARNQALSSYTGQLARSPPWMQKIFSSTMAAKGRQLKTSQKTRQSLML
jgi:hypothetical protein